jgi:hypothetical protein
MKNKLSIFFAIILLNSPFVNAQSIEELFIPIPEKSIDEGKMGDKKELIEKNQK